MRARRTDHNHRNIRTALRDIGCTVADTSSAGDGFPDLVVGVVGVNLLMEIKDGARRRSSRKLTAAQIVFQGEWRGQYVVVESVDEAVEVVQQVRSGMMGMKQQNENKT